MDQLSEKSPRLEFVSEMTTSYIQRGVPSAIVDALVADSSNLEQLRCRLERALFGEPLEYLRGYTTFYGREFKTDRRAYVPNCETEHLVEVICRDMCKGSSVLDVGTGCGNIAISIAAKRTDLAICALDVDPGALDLARENAKRSNVDIAFFESAYVYGLPEYFPCPDAIVADMPWGTFNPHEMLHPKSLPQLAHMPPTALCHPEGPFRSYQELLKSIESRGWRTTIYIELGALPINQLQQAIAPNWIADVLQFGPYAIGVLHLGSG